MIQEIGRSEWVSFLDTFSRAHAGWLVSIDVAERSGRMATEAVEQPLVGITADCGGNRPSVSVVVGRGPDGVLTHLVEGAARVPVNRTTGGTEAARAIEGARGASTP